MACQHSPQKNYYYLTAMDNSELNANNTASSNIIQVIGIGPIEIPEYLSRSQIIDNQTNNTLVMANNAYWAEPLDKSIARVISLNLIHMNNARSFVDFPWRNDSKPRYSIRLHIDDLSRAGKNVKINATWELMDNGNKSNLLRKNFTHSTTADSGAKALALAYSKLLANLAEEMNTELNKIQQ